jgi:hypothetical protein
MIMMKPADSFKIVTYTNVLSEIMTIKITSITNDFIKLLHLDSVYTYAYRPLCCCLVEYEYLSEKLQFI